MTAGLDWGSYNVEWIPLKKLSVVWAAAQRPFKEAWAVEIAKSLDPDLLEPLVVSTAGADGIHHVIDGQHRAAAVKSLYGDEETVPCRVLGASSAPEAASLFRQLNVGRKGLLPVDNFLVAVAAGDEPEVSITSIVERLGYKISRHKIKGGIQSVQALRHVYLAYGADILRDTLQTILTTWGGDDSNAMSANNIKGFAAFIAAHREELDFRRLRENVAKSLTSRQLAGRAKYHQELTNLSSSAAVAHVLTQTYNAAAKTGKLVHA